MGGFGAKRSWSNVCISQGEPHFYNCSAKGALHRHPFLVGEPITSQHEYLVNVYTDHILEERRGGDRSFSQTSQSSGYKEMGQTSTVASWGLVPSSNTESSCIVPAALFVG
jgi:hypothetical protein